MINAIGVKNFRSLKETSVIEYENSGYIDIKPFNILLGKNSSGKSTFLRLFPLLKQSVSGRTRGALALYGDFVDFGDFKTVLSNSTEKQNEDFLEIKYKGTIENFRYGRHFFIISRDREEKKDEKLDYEVIQTIKNSKKNECPYISTLQLNFQGNNIRFNVSEDGRINEFYINDENFDEVFEDIGVVYTPQRSSFPQLDMTSGKINSVNTFFKPLLELITDNKEIKGVSINFINFLNFTNSIALLDIKQFESNFLNKYLNVIKKEKILDSKYAKKLENLLNEEESKKELHNKFLLAKFNYIYDMIGSDLFENSYAISYSKPLRANADRYYRSRTLFVDEINSDGSNLVEFYSNLSETKKKSLENWLRDNFNFSFSVETMEGHQSIFIIESDKSQHNITDMGFGYSQILPIVTQLWVLVNKNTRQTGSVNYIYTIEQPELHLHPALQCKLINALAKVSETGKQNGIKISFILETHSETIVNQFGKLVEAQKLPAEDVSVLIFSKETSSSFTKINSSSFNSEGELNNWPIGFFGEDE